MSALTDDSKRSKLRQVFILVDVLIVLYIVLDAIAQALPPHYSPISQAESLLAVGPYGYVMAVNFLNRGIFSLLFVYATVQLFSVLGENWRNYKLGLYAIVIWGVGALLLTGFPATGSTLWVHAIIAYIVLFAAPLGEFSISLKIGRVKALAGVRKTALVIALFGVLFMVFFLWLLPFIPNLYSNYDGLFERFLLGSIIAWIGVMSTYALRHLEDSRN
jgi:Protein of unknown function (DUF998)